MPRKKAGFPLTAYLLDLPAKKKLDRKGKWHASALKEDLKCERIPVPDCGPGAVLYACQYPAQVPKWARHFPAAASVLNKLKNRSTAGLLLMAVDGKAVGISFGLGRHLLRSELIVESFGLKTTLNIIPRDRLRSIDKMTFDQLTRHSRVQVTQQGDVAALGVNVDQDLVRAVTGVPKDASLYGPRISGRDAIHVCPSVDGLDKLPGVVRELLKAHGGNAYKKTFSWIDQIREVSSSSLIDALNAELEKRLAAKSFDRLWMAPPEIVDWERIAGFKYRDSDALPLHHDLRIQDFLKESRARSASKPMTIATLKNRAVLAYDAVGGSLYDRWSAYKCIYVEVEHAGETYLLSAGKWFRVDKSYVAKVDRYVKKIPATSLSLPAWKPGEAEGKYNKRAVAALKKGGAQAELLDAKNLSIGGGHSKVEFCDVMTDGPRRLLFVKRYGHSSTLSHLFAQASVSGRLLKTDEDFRTLVNTKLPPPMQLDATRAPDASSFEIAFVILSRSTKPLLLPFFSRVSLMIAHENLVAMGYPVTLVKVGP